MKRVTECRQTKMSTCNSSRKMKNKEENDRFSNNLSFFQKNKGKFVALSNSSIRIKDRNR